MSILLVLLISTILSAISIPQTWLHLASYLPDHNDTLLITYLINQVQLNIIHHQPIYWGSFFAPFANTLTFSEPFITSALISLPTRLFGFGPIVIFNINLLSGFILTSLTLFLLIKELTASQKTALLGSLIFTFSPIHLSFLPHLQVFNIWLLPLGILFWYKFLRGYETKFLILFLIVLFLQFLDSVLVAYFLMFTSICLYIYHPIPLKKNYFAAIFVFLVVTFIAIYPYLQLNLTYPEATRPIRDAAHFSLNVLDPFIKFGSVLLIGLFVVSLFKQKLTSLTKPWLTLTLFSLVLSLGPVLKWDNSTVKIIGIPIPLPYTLFYYFFPGFQGMRTPSRWIILAGLAATIFVCVQLYKKIEKTDAKTYILMLMAGFVFIIFENHLPISTFDINIQLPTVYERVRLLPKDQVILELPVKLWNMPGNEIESLRSIYSLSHQHRRFNGYSGFAPQSWIDLVNQINAYGLTQKNVELLKKWGVGYVVSNNQLLPL